MRMVFDIAKAELKNLFYSPVAWFLAIAFMCMCGWYFTNALYPIIKIQEAYIEANPAWKNWGPYPMTLLFFTSPNSIYSIALQNLFLFIPLLTMGLISREVNTGSIKLLYSSPVKIRQVVLGKYLSIMFYNLLLVGITGIFLVTAVFSIKSADYGALLSAALGFYLLTCAYAAIGVFMSSLTSYQIISAIGTFIIIFILGRIGLLWQKIDFVRDLTYFLYLSGRTERMLKGLIASKDVIYFLMVIFMFVSFTILRLKGHREVKPWYIKLSRVMAVIVAALMIGYICSLPRFTLYWDTTAAKANTIHDNTQQLLRDMGDEPLEITLYTNLLGNEATYGFPEARNSYLTYMWEKYVRFKPDINFKYNYYYYYHPSIDGGKLAAMFPGEAKDVVKEILPGMKVTVGAASHIPPDEMAKEIAKGFKISAKPFKPYDSINKDIDLEPEGHRLVMRLKYKGRTEFLRTYKGLPYPAHIDQIWPNEMNVAAALKRLVYPEKIPTILYTTGNLERRIDKSGEREYRSGTISKTRRETPVNLGFNIDTISLDHQDIPAGIAALVMADPKTALSETTQQKIREYIDKGGNMILLGEPGKQDVLNPVLQSMGVTLLEGNIVQPTVHETPDKVFPKFTPFIADLSDEYQMLDLRRALASKQPFDTMGVGMFGVTGLSFSDSNSFVKKPLLVTSEKSSWLRKSRLVVDSAAVIYSPWEGDLMGSFPTSLQLTRKAGNKEQKIAVFSDADFMSNLRVQGGEQTNKTVFHWMSNNEFPVYTPRPDPADNLITVSSNAVKNMRIVYVWVLPSLLLVAGTILLIRRKRK